MATRVGATTMIPLFHDFEQKSVLIIGGGSVALRKARRFADEADVKVIAPAFEDKFREISCEQVQRRVTQKNICSELGQAYLVVPATDDVELNSTIETEARRNDCLVNRVDEKGDIVVPSHAESEEISIAISTHGSSPAMSKYLRRRVTPILQSADSMVRLQWELREELKDTVDPQEKRRRLLWEVIENEKVWELLPHSFDEAKTIARELVTTEN